MMQRLVRWLRTSPHADVVGAALVLAALLTVFFWRAIFLGETWVPGDLIYELDPLYRGHAPAGFVAPGNRLLSDQVYLIYPWQVEIRRALAERRVPLWATTLDNGQPLLANGQLTVWDPFWIVARLFPLNTSFAVAALLKLWVGGFSTFLLARQVGISRRGSLLAMIVFAFSGPMIVWLGIISGVVAWLPLMLYLSERALAIKSNTLFLLVGAVIACQFYGAHPESSFYVVLIWGLYGLVRAVAYYGWRTRFFFQALGGMALAFAFGVLLSAAILLPTLEGIVTSYILIQRQASASAAWWQTLLFSWHNWPTLVTILLPQFWGTPIDNSFWYPYQNYNEQDYYVGIVPLALGILTLLSWWHDRKHAAHAPSALPAPVSPRGFWLGLALVLLGVTAQLPLFNIVSVLPLWRLANHGRLRMVYALAAALLAGYGLDTLATASSQFNAPKKLLITLTVMAAISLFMIGGAYAGLTLARDPFIAMGQQQAQAMKAADHPMFPYSLEYYYERINVRYEQARRLYTPATPEMFLPLGMALAVGLLEWGRRRGWNKALWLNGLIALTCADLFWINLRINPTTPPKNIFPDTPAIAYLKQQPDHFRVAGLYQALMPNTAMVFGLQDARGHEPVVPRRPAILLNRIEGGYRLNHYAILRSADSPLFDLMNVEYLVADRDVGGRWQLAFAEADSPVRVYRNPSVLPRAFIVYEWELAASAPAALDRVVDKSFDFRSRAVLEGNTSGLPAVTPARGTGQARIVQYKPEHVVIETDSTAEGILVLTDTYTPGWQAVVDGQPADIYVADYAFRGVHIPAGQHQITFTYVPTSFSVGAGISLAAVALCIVLVAVSVYRKVRCASSTI